MNTNYTITMDSPSATIDVAGGKGASLARMVEAGLPVPSGFIVTTDAYRAFIRHNNLQPEIVAIWDKVDISKTETLEIASQHIHTLFKNAVMPGTISDAVVQGYLSLSGTNPAVAVRSSATAEDLPEASFAGQQETYLNVSGPDAVLESVRNCWASLWTARAISYRMHQDISPEDVSLAVVVQGLVNAEVSGILFTANPLNGSRNQMLVNASWGLGEAIVGGLVTPDTIIYDKNTASILSREIGKKETQTVRVSGGTEEKPVPQDLQELSVLDDEQVVNLALLASQIEKLYGMPMDIEWALLDDKFWILQARPITALPVLEPSPPSEWKLPRGAYAAMRNNIIELMIDPLTPLFKTLGLGAVNTSYNRLLGSFMGKNNVMPENPIIAVNEYAYYNGSVKFGPMLGVILDSLNIVRRMFTGAVERWTEEGHPNYCSIVQQWEDHDWQNTPAVEIVEAVKRLTEAAIDAYGALVAGVIPAAWMSEAWFTFTYKFLKRKDDPKAPVYLMGFDNIPLKAEKALYDLAQWTKVYPHLQHHLIQMKSSEIARSLMTDALPGKVEKEIWQAWCSRFQVYLKKFGHMIYNLDFGNPVPADEPEPVLETFKLFLKDGGVNPYERQQQSVKRRERAVHEMLSRLRGRKLKRFQKNLQRAQKFAPLREDGLAEVGLSYPIIRKGLRVLGNRMVNAEVLGKVADIYWLEERELIQAAQSLDKGKTPEPLKELIPQRKAVWRVARTVAPPLMLPQIKIFGVDIVALKTGAGKQKGKVLKGVAASPGQVTAPACVLYGPSDFSKMDDGDVLVASLTTPAWTPLFARASAVVTDIGGPLSHGSIVAREYGIPAVLGTVNATTRIIDGQRITVDGSGGTVTMH